MTTRYSQVRSRHYDLDLQRYYRMPVVQVSLQLVLSVFIIAFFLMFALRPTIETIITLQKNIDDSKQTLQKLDTKVSALQRAATVLTALQPSLPYIESSIPSTEAGYRAFTSELELLAAQAGVRLVSENFGGTVLYSQLAAPFTLSKNESVVPMTVNLQVSGTYSAVSTFLQSLIRLDRVMNIASATMAHEAASTTTGGVNLSLTGTVYYLADQAQITKTMTSVTGVKP